MHERKKKYERQKERKKKYERQTTNRKFIMCSCAFFNSNIFSTKMEFFRVPKKSQKNKCFVERKKNYKIRKEIVLKILCKLFTAISN